MWLLGFLPDSLLTAIINTILVAGLVGTIVFCFVTNGVLRWLPMLAPYYRLLQIISVLLLLLGVYFKGGYSTEMQWRQKVTEVEQKLAEAEAKSQKENIKIVEKVVKKTEYIRLKAQDTISYIDREIVKYDVKFAPGGSCEIPKEFIQAHNQAVDIGGVKK
jgi:hypothetical protein